MAPISFFAEIVENPIFNEPDYKSALTKIIIHENYILQSLSFIFCTDEYLLHINEQYLSHSYYTDVITFDYSSKPSIIEGDIFISLQRVKHNATKYSISFLDEFHRVMIHGLLHLLGYGDSTIEQSHQIRTKENFYLSFFVTATNP